MQPVVYYICLLFVNNEQDNPVYFLGKHHRLFVQDAAKRLFSCIYVYIGSQEVLLVQRLTKVIFFKTNKVLLVNYYAFGLVTKLLSLTQMILLSCTPCAIKL